MTKYEPLAQFLRATATDEVTASFYELEKTLGEPLPPSAHRLRAWWANERTKSQSKAWLNAGWQVWKVDFDRRTVQFKRSGPSPQRSPGRPRAGGDGILTIALEHLSGAAVRLIDDYAEEQGLSRSQAAAALLNDAGLERRRAVLDTFRSRFTGRVGSDSVGLVREDRDAR